MTTWWSGALSVLTPRILSICCRRVHECCGALDPHLSATAMSTRNTPSSIPRPRPRVTPDLFRPPPTTSSQSPNVIPSPTPSGLPLNINRKRARAETVSTTPDRVSDPTGRTNLQPTTSGTPRAYSAGFPITRSAAPAEEVTLSSLLAPSTHVISNDARKSDSATDSSAFSPDLVPESSARTNWKSSLFSAAAAVAGGLLDFCRNTKFLGFRAGGGSPYDESSRALDGDGDQAPNTPGPLTKKHDTRQFSWGAPNLPGHYPADDGWGNSTIHEDDPHETRSAKRRQISQGGDWVMVSPTSPPDPTPSRSVSHSNIPRPSPRPPTIRRVNPSASPRRTSYQPTALASSSSGRRTSTINHTSKYLRSARSMSSFSSHSTGTMQNTSNDYDATTTHSPRGSTMTSADVARFRNKKEREERQQDASLRKLNDQLRAMIREGKAALGTKVEVELDEDDI